MNVMGSIAGRVGPDCSMDENMPPIPGTHSGPVTCDVKMQPCLSMKIQADDLIRSDRLSCRLHANKVSIKTVTQYLNARELGYIRGNLWNVDMMGNQYFKSVILGEGANMV